MMRVALLFLFACGGVSVSPIDPRDPNLPPQTRESIAGAQDAVVAARARRSLAARELEAIEQWAEDTSDQTNLEGSTGASLEALADARVELAETELDEAARSVELAEAMLELTYAERAVNDDLGSYDLEPLRLRVEQIQEDLSELRRERLAARQRELEANRNWWAAYASYAGGGGDTSSYWLAGREPIREVVEAEPSSEEGENESSASEASEDEGEGEGDDG